MSTRDARRKRRRPFSEVHQISLRLAPEPRAAGAARRSLERLRDYLSPEKLADVQLAVSELVNNSILHAGLSPGDRIGVLVTASNGGVRGEVRDTGPGFEVPPRLRPRPDLTGGWGLPIVEKISDRWGIEQDGSVRVWFELD